MDLNDKLFLFGVIFIYIAFALLAFQMATIDGDSFSVIIAALFWMLGYICLAASQDNDQ